MLKVMVVIGSDSDTPKIKDCLDVLDQFGVDWKLYIASAHRAPDLVAELAESAAAWGYGVIIAAAGLAAALPGSLAAHTTLPVIGIPLNASPLNGVDALYAMVQMPSGVPVAVVAIDGAKNGGLLAIQILAVGDSVLTSQLVAYKGKLAEAVRAKNDWTPGTPG